MNLQRKLYREKIEEKMLFKEEEEARDPFLNWPDAFYEEKNPEKRESLLLRRMQQEGAERQVEEDRLSVLYERYPVLKERREKEESSRKQGLFSREVPLVDLYMYSWMNILIRGETEFISGTERARGKRWRSFSGIFTFLWRRKESDARLFGGENWSVSLRSG